MAVDSIAVTNGSDIDETHHNNLRKDFLLGKSIGGTETDGATITIDWSDLSKGKTRKVTLGGNRALVFSNAVADQWIILDIIQDATGGRTITSWPSGKWPGGSAIDLTSDANAIDTIAIHYTGTTYHYYPVQGLA